MVVVVALTGGCGGGLVVVALMVVVVALTGGCGGGGGVVPVPAGITDTR